MEEGQEIIGLAGFHKVKNFMRKFSTLLIERLMEVILWRDLFSPTPLLAVQDLEWGLIF